MASYTDTSTLARFFQAVKANIGELYPTWLMSDIADQFHITWVATFMHTPKHILCTCHIFQACKNHLKIKRDSETEEKVYHTLKVLMDETEYKFKQII